MAATVNHRKFTEPEEDIAAIAKQISDHAEAIYQNWKSRGLAPTEILSCNNIAAAEQKFGSALSPKKTVDIVGRTPDLDSNNLERLVSNFVVEDKARLARRTEGSPSSVQFAKRKFETREGPAHRDDVLRIYPKSPTAPAPPALSPFSIDTIEATLPEDLPAAKTDGLQTWPLKNRSTGGRPIQERFSPRNREYMEEVAKEEERLINALKTGVIIAEDTSEKPGILQKAAAKEKPTGLVKRVVKSYQEQGAKKSPRGFGRRTNESAVPHPQLSAAHKHHIRTNPTAANPVRPFLTRGSVAERVLIFEKCPAELGLDKRKPGLQVRFFIHIPPYFIFNAYKFWGRCGQFISLYQNLE
ncbi:hypothetical protein AAG570_000243 [Ranatra chinensis]|uniref:Uncharacterized protein n=1 Tax=Ranatra chinensis TaxID=642074 RepID=A0ABD0YWH3_9HEMI